MVRERNHDGENGGKVPEPYATRTGGLVCAWEERLELP